MDEETPHIDGKVLVFTDLHLGLAGNKLSKLAIAIRAVKAILDYIKKNDIKAVLFLGDWNHSRVTTENNVLNVSYKLMTALAKLCSVYLVLGNHDIYMKNSVDINSLVVFKDLANIKIISEPTQVSINKNKSLLVPWIGDVSTYPKTDFDMMFGHFDVSTKYLVKSYIQDHMQTLQASDEVANKLDADDLLGSSLGSKDNSGDLVGDFVEVVKQNGTVFSGHIHSRKEFLAKGRNFIFVGSPYQQNLGEIGNRCGFYVIDEQNAITFEEIKGIPVHVELKMSEVSKNIDSFDFSIVRGNILHKVYDVEVDRMLDAKVDQKIQDNKPYEELLPDYSVGITENKTDTVVSESVELLKKSKLEYIQNYISNIDPKTLESDKLDKDKLYQTLETYYNTVVA